MSKARARIRSAGGYSLVELLIVLALLGVLASAAAPLAQTAAQRAQERELKRSLWEIRDAIDAYRHAVEGGLIAPAADGSPYPPTLRALTEGVPDLGAAGRRHTFLRRMPRDPFSTQAGSADESWGLRSYQSPSQRPQPGADVYDVYSRSERIGLNGVPLKDW
jgi:general secretion pathway protein G